MKKSAKVATTTPALSLSHVFKSYERGPDVLVDFNLDIEPGTFCVLLGSSGSGKSTLLKCIAGLTPVDAGNIELLGEKLTRKRLQHVGMVHQDFGLSNRLTAAQNVMSGKASVTPWWRVVLQKYSRQTELKACTLLDDVGLSETHANQVAGKLSGGQKQRVGIARALISDPTLILADEPVASLDPKSANETMSLLKRASKERGAAVLCSLHQIELSKQYADRIVGLNRGTIMFDGPPDALTASAVQSIFDIQTASAGETMELA